MFARADVMAPPSFAQTTHLPEVPLDDAVERVVAGLKQQGLAILADTDLSELLTQRVGINVRPYHVIETCHPGLAARALGVAKDAGLVATARLCLWAERGGTTIAIVSPDRAVAALGRAHLDEFSAELGAHIVAAVHAAARERTS
jgi:uncharacterized protein (DUF302 family)